MATIALLFLNAECDWHSPKLPVGKVIGNISRNGHAYFGPFQVSQVSIAIGPVLFQSYTVVTL
jgi:hypothetical protein